MSKKKTQKKTFEKSTHLKTVNGVNLRAIVNDEVRKAMLQEKHIFNTQSILETNKYFKTTKQKFINELIKPTLDKILRNNLNMVGKDIAFHIMKSFLNKI